MNNNIMQFLQMVKSQSNPQQTVMNMLQEQMGQNPVFENLFNLAKNNNTKEIEQVARNMLKEQGLDFDKEFNSFKKSLGL